MQQVVQNIRTGKLDVESIPDPIARPGCVLIANACSVISAGTEKTAIDLARKSLLGKARERPDHVRRVLEKLKQEGFFNTLSQVSGKLDEPMPLGYSSAGIVLACGAGVQEFKPGDRVASNGPHAGVVCVPAHLCAHIPETVPFESAAFAVLGAIALQGVRLAELRLGDTALVIGLGLIGQIAVSLLKAQGCRVIGADPDAAKCRLARERGADFAAASISKQDLLNRTRGIGADAVLITAATTSDEPVTLAGECVRKKGRVVSVGAVGMNLPRRPYFFSEAEFVVSCSYGPGRYDPAYEERGHDYPAGYVRWTEQRNLQAVLDLMADGRLDVTTLVTHRFSIDEAGKAYDLIGLGREPYLGIVLSFPDVESRPRMQTLTLRAPATSGEIGVGCLGAGTFARMVLLPALKKAGGFRLRTLCSAGGLSAAHAGGKLGFELATTDEASILADESIRAVFVLTRHDQHARQVVDALAAGKSVFVEKPLCLTGEELAEIEAALQSAVSTRSSALLMVGFNRRFAAPSIMAREFIGGTGQPIAVSIRFNAGEIPADHWTQDELAGGGRIIGEACHAIDLATFLTGARPVRVFAESVGGGDAKTITDDQCFITLRHANGSVSSIAYLAGGDKAYPKERVEALGGGRIAVIDDFRSVTLVHRGHTRTKKFSSQDKGHLAEAEAFATALKSGGAAPIPWDELRATTLAAILSVRSLREGVPFDIV